MSAFLIKNLLDSRVLLENKVLSVVRRELKLREELGKKFITEKEVEIIITDAVASAIGYNTYEVEYWVRSADGFDAKYMKVHEETETLAILKAKQVNQTHKGKDYKITKKLNKA